MGSQTSCPEQSCPEQSCPEQQSKYASVLYTENNNVNLKCDVGTLNIEKGLYGKDTETVNVTSNIQSFVKNNGVNFIASTRTFGINDPAPGKVKELLVNYKCS